MQNFLDRTLPILEEDGLKALSAPLVTLAGLGGVGGGTFLNLVRCGVRRFRLAENGIFDPPDMNRQAAAFASTMGMPKIEVYERLAREINPEVELELFPEGLSVGNVERFLEGGDVHVGVIDVEKGADVKARESELVRRYNIPLFTAGVFGFGAAMIAYHPEGMSSNEFWGLMTKQTAGGSVSPSFLIDRFDKTVMERVKNAVKTGKIATTSVGGALSGAILAAEVLAYLLRRTGIVNREIIFAPKFIAVDLLGPSLEIVDITK